MSISIISVKENVCLLVFMEVTVAKLVKLGTSKEDFYPSLSLEDHEVWVEL